MHYHYCVLCLFKSYCGTWLKVIFHFRFFCVVLSLVWLNKLLVYFFIKIYKNVFFEYNYYKNIEKKSVNRFKLKASWQFCEIMMCFVIAIIVSVCTFFIFLLFLSHIKHTWTFFFEPSGNIYVRENKEIFSYNPAYTQSLMIPIVDF